MHQVFPKYWWVIGSIWSLKELWGWHKPRLTPNDTAWRFSRSPRYVITMWPNRWLNSLAEHSDATEWNGFGEQIEVLPSSFFN